MNKLGAILGWMGAGGGVLIPAIGIFKEYGPPLFPPASILITAIAGIIVVVAAIAGKKHSTWLPGLFGSICCSALGAGLLIAYVIALPNWTVRDPQDESQRWQVGFARWDWSLTEKGLKYQEMFPDDSNQQWMLTAALFKDDGPRVLWKPSCVLAAGVILVVFYFASFLFWTVGCTSLAQLAVTSGVDPPESPTAA